MELDLGPFGLFEASLEDVDTSSVHENGRLKVFGTWKRASEGDELIETEAVLSILLEELPPLRIMDSEALLVRPWAEFQIED